jgi:hypothetical protein
MAFMVAVIGAGCGGTQSSGGTSTAAAADTSSNTTTAAHTSHSRASLSPCAYANRRSVDLALLVKGGSDEF